MKRQTFSALLPFSGFYCSWHSEAIDYAEEALLSDSNGDPFGPAISDLFYDEVDYAEVHDQYAKTYTAELADRLGLPSLTYEERVSPREYNFQTDRIFATLSRSDLRKVLCTVRGERFRQKIRDWFTSRDGFCSSYPNRLSDWPPVDQWDHNHVGAALSAYADAVTADQWGATEADIAADLDSDGTLYEWLSQAAPNSRALRIRDYLINRQERRYK